MATNIDPHICSMPPEPQSPEQPAAQGERAIPRRTADQAAAAQVSTSSPENPRIAADAPPNPASTEAFAARPNLPELPKPAARTTGDGAQAMRDLARTFTATVRRETGADTLEALKAAGGKAEVKDAEKTKIVEANLAKIKTNEVLAKFCKAFKIIGLIVGAIASAGAVVAGALTANPVAIGFGCTALLFSVNKVVETFSEGKWGLTPALEGLGKKMGMSEHGAALFADSVQLGISFATAALSCGLGAGTLVQDAVSAAQTGLSVVDIVRKIILGKGEAAEISQETSGDSTQVNITFAGVSREYSLARPLDKADLGTMTRELNALLLTPALVDKDLVSGVMETIEELHGNVEAIAGLMDVVDSMKALSI